MMKLQTPTALAVGVLTATFGGFEAQAQTAAPIEARNVVLIHGAKRVKGRGAQASAPWYRALMLPIAPSAGRTTTRRPGSIWATTVSGILADKS